MEETGVPGDPSQVTDNFFYIKLYRIHIHGIELTALPVTGTDCTGTGRC